MHLFTLCGTHGVGNVSAKIFWRKTHESTTSIPRTNVIKRLHRVRSSHDRRQVHKPRYARALELFFGRLGNEGCDVITQSTTRSPIMENNTTRKFPRTFTEAFPNSLENGAAIEIHVHECSTAEKIIRVISLIGLIVVAMDCLVWRV